MKKTIPYEDYLKSDHWNRLRIECFRKHGRICAICRSEKTIQVHHWRYRENWFKTSLEDLMPLCDACHGMVHRHGSGGKTKQELIDQYRDRFMNKPKKIEPQVSWMCRPKPRWLRKQEAQQMAQAKRFVNSMRNCER